MTTLEFIGLLIAGTIVTGFTMLVSIQIPQPAKKRENLTSVHSLTPTWVLLIEGVMIIAASFLLYRGFWMVCGIWFGAALVVGILTEAIAWKVTPKEKIDLWLKKAIEMEKRMAEINKVQKEDAQRLKDIAEPESLKQAQQGVFKTKVSRQVSGNRPTNSFPGRTERIFAIKNKSASNVTVVGDVQSLYETESDGLPEFQRWEFLCELEPGKSQKVKCLVALNPLMGVSIRAKVFAREEAPKTLTNYLDWPDMSDYPELSENLQEGDKWMVVNENGKLILKKM